MSGYNLPPGVNVSDIPGNRPSDEEFERVLDWIIETGLTNQEIVAAIVFYMNSLHMKYNIGNVPKCEY